MTDTPDQLASYQNLCPSSGSSCGSPGALLTAQGSSWGGVYYGGSSNGVLQGSTVEKVSNPNGGAVTLDYSNARLDHATIKNNTGHGIADLNSVNEVIEYTAVQGNSKHGLYISNSYGFFGSNNVTATTTTSGNAAAYVVGGNPAIQRGGGVNTLTGGYYGLYATSSAVVDANGYTLSQPGNRIFGNQTYEARAVSSSTVYGQYNYWGANGPQTNADGSSVVYSSPYTTTDPGAAFKNDVTDPSAQSDSLELATVTMLEAKDAADAGDVLRALELYESVARSSSRYSGASIGAIRTLYVRSRNPMALQILESLAEMGGTHRANALEALASARLSVGEPEYVVEAANLLMEEFPGTRHEFWARVTVFYGYRRLGRNADAVATLTAARADDPDQETALAVAMSLPDGTESMTYPASELVAKQGQTGLTEFELSSYPNPFNPTGVVTYRLSREQRVVLRVYDALGRQVSTLVEGVQHAGTHRADVNLDGFSSGLYLLRAETEEGPFVHRILLSK